MLMESEQELVKIIKEYPAIANIPFDLTDTSGVYTRVEYVKHDGKWVEQHREVSEFDLHFYICTLNSLSFWRSTGSKERIKVCNTYFGKLPVSISSISCNQAVKTMRDFKFYVKGVQKMRQCQ